MAMDLINLVQEVKQKIGVEYNTAVDVNEIYEELEQHHVREDRVQFVASLFMKKLGVTSCSNVIGGADDVTLENKNEGVLPCGYSVESTFGEEKQEAPSGVSRPDSKTMVDLQADAGLNLLKDKVDGQLNNQIVCNVSVPCSSAVSGIANLPSSSNDVGPFSPAALDFDYDVNNNDPNNNTEYEAPPNSVSSTIEEPTVSVLHEEDDEFAEANFIDQEQIREKLLNETGIIHSVVPQRTFGEIYSFLESNMDNENRLQVVMKYFLNQDFPSVATIAGPNNAKHVSKASNTATGCNSVIDVPDSTCPSTSSKAACDIPGTSGAANEDVNSQDAIVLSDSETSCVPDAESDVVIQDESICEVVFVDCVGKSGKRRSPSKSGAIPAKIRKVNRVSNSSDDDVVEAVHLTEVDLTGALDLTLNTQRHPRNTYHKHFHTVKEMFPNIPEEDLVKICSTYQETDEDLVRIIDSLLVTVNKVEELLEEAVNPLPELGPYLDPFLATEQGVAAAQAKLTTPASSVEPDQNCIAVFQQASSERDGPGIPVTLPDSGGVRPSTSTSSSLDGGVGTSKVVQGSVSPSAEVEPARIDVAAANIPACLGQSKDVLDKRVNEVAAIVAASCARFTASVANVKSAKKTPTETSVGFVNVHSDQNPTVKSGIQNVNDKVCKRKKRKQVFPSGVSDVPSQIPKPVKKRKNVLSLNRETPTTLGCEEIGGQVDLKVTVPNHENVSTSTLAVPAPPEVHDETNVPSTSGTQNDPPVKKEELVTPVGTVQDAEATPDENAREQQHIDDRYECLLSIFPQADPTYLLDKCIEIGDDEGKMREFIQDALEKKDYPTYQDYQNRMEEERQKKKVTTEFSVESFLEIFPDPSKYFLEQKHPKHGELGLVFLKNRYPRTRYNDIISCFKNCRYNLAQTCQMLDNVKTVMKTKRPMQVLDPVSKMDLKFLQEVAFIENRALIEEHIKIKEETKKLAFEEAKQKNELLECACCFNDEVLLEDIGTCNEGHLFCKDCIQKSAEVKIGEGKTTFPCLTTCDSEFSLKTLQKFLKASLLSKMLQTRQLEEVKAAGIDGIEYCPYCNFATILPEEDKVLHCLNPECMKESCRFCHEPNHVPKRCEEVERSDEVKARTYIENKMTEALIRVCWKCNKPFIKEDGCNKMTCSCGAMMCYICRQKVTDYSHFNGQGGSELHKCPLYSTNDELHVDVVQREALKAKQTVMEQNPNVQLKHDPTQVLPARTNAPRPPGAAPPHRPRGAYHLAMMPPEGQLIHLMHRLRDVLHHHQQLVRPYEDRPPEAHMPVVMIQHQPNGVPQRVRIDHHQVAVAPQQPANHAQPANMPGAYPAVQLARAAVVQPARVANVQPARPAVVEVPRRAVVQPARAANEEPRGNNPILYIAVPGRRRHVRRHNADGGPLL